MVVMGKGDAALMILETAEEAEPQTGWASPPEPIMSVVHVVHICPDYVPKLCAHQNPSCLLSFPRVFSCVWSLFSLMPWFGFHNFSRAHQNPSIIMSLLSFLLSHILLRLVILTLKKRSESFSLMPWFELHNLSIVVRSFTTMIFTLSLTVVSSHHPLSAERKGGYE